MTAFTHPSRIRRRRSVAALSVINFLAVWAWVSWRARRRELTARNTRTAARSAD